MRPRHIADAPAHCVATRFLLFGALASGVAKHRHDALFEGEVAAVVLLDGDALHLELPLDGDVLLAPVHICLRGCSSVRRKITRKCLSGIRVH